jgi:hypothetical protein
MKNYILICLLVLSVSRSGFGQSSFTKIASGPVVTDAADGHGCAWVDFDNDGDLDLYVSCSRSGANLLYRNDRNGLFTRITTGPLVSAGVGSYSSSWADMDNDGLLDVFVSRQSGRGLLFRQLQINTFARSTLPLGGFSWGSALADYNNDGFVDLLVADTTRTVLWHNDGQGGLVAVTNTPIATVPSADSITWVDYDNDGDPDVLVANDGVNSRLYRNDGEGVFTAIINGELAQQSAGVSGAAWGDYDNDGFPDLLLARLDSSFQQELPSFLFHNNGDGAFTQVQQSPFIDDVGFALSAAWGDYDNDGWLDLFVTNFGNGGRNRLYRNKSDGSFERVLSGSVANDLGSSHGCAWGDYDRDGFLDLFVANATVGGGDSNDFLYHNEGNSNAWLMVKCVGSRSNRSAIGAKVRLKATINRKTFWQLREINTGDGWSQNALEAHFGLGNATNIETLRIEWPSGAVQEWQNVAAKQYLTITEPALLAASLSNGAPQIKLYGGRNLQYGLQVSTDLKTWSPLSTLIITNLDGRAMISDAAPRHEQRFYQAVLR